MRGFRDNLLNLLPHHIEMNVGDAIKRRIDIKKPKLGGRERGARKSLRNCQIVNDITHVFVDERELWNQASRNVFAASPPPKKPFHGFPLIFCMPWRTK